MTHQKWLDRLVTGLQGARVSGSAQQDALHPERPNTATATKHLGQCCTCICRIMKAAPGQRAGRRKRREGKSFVKATRFLASPRKKSKQSLREMRPPGDLSGQGAEWGQSCQAGGTCALPSHQAAGPQPGSAPQLSPARGSPSHLVQQQSIISITLTSPADS